MIFRTPKQKKETDTLRANFARVMWIHGAMVYTLSVRLTGNAKDGGALTQATFVEAYKNHEKFHAESTPGSWLYGICVGVWKKRYARQRFLGIPIPTVFISKKERVFVATEGLDSEKAVHRAIAQLPGLERAAVIMRDMDDKPLEDVAQALTVPMPVAKEALLRGREKMRRMLEPLLRKAS